MPQPPPRPGSPSAAQPVPPSASSATSPSAPSATSPSAAQPAKPGTALALREDPAPSPAPANPQAALEEFAKDLRELRAKAELGYPEMAELSHYTMKTLASAAGGLRLPTLPVTTAYVRACGGNVADWEDRWQRLAAMIEPKGDRGPEYAHTDVPGTASSGADRGERDEEQGHDAASTWDPSSQEHLAPQRPPSQRPSSPGPQGPPGPPGGEQVYVITSAAPRRPYR